jgi:uncharacterized protein with HEPN domain
VKEDKLYLIHIRECIDRIEQYTVEGRGSFINDQKTQDAVLRNLHTLSESVQRISENLKTQYPVIDWRSISGFRNVVVHDYLGIDLPRIWDIVEKDIPDLKEKIRIILEENTAVNSE